MAQTSATPQPSGRPSNPFPVFPVQPLSELHDIRSATVETPEVRIVRDAVVDFAKTFDAQGSAAPRPLVLAVKGDFGTGKTHLILYARSLLEAETGIIRSQTSLSSSPNESTHKTLSNSTSNARSCSMLCVGSETTIEDWYSTIVGPALIKSVQPRELMRELMTDVACKVAEDSPLTAHLAPKFRESRQAMFQALRNADEIDSSTVEGRFSDLLAELTPEADDAFRRGLSALRWTETAPLAERWLAGEQVDANELKRLGDVGTHDRTVRASVAISAVAAICRYLARPFAFFIDEFEHLARHDRRHQSRRNVTWVKRLVEALSGRNAMVFISGHWEAWEQQGDFLDRFMGRPPLQLVRLDTDDIQTIVKVLAPEWSRLFLADAAAALADVTAGNIRRVMTILYDLYAQTAITDRLVTPKMVMETAAHRLHRAPEEGFLPIVEQAVRANGGTIERDLILSGRRVDAAARVNGELRLLICIQHARDEAALLEAGEQLADLVRATRKDAPRVRGLFIAVGAVNPDHLRTLDAARSELDVVNGESSQIGPPVTKLVATALTAAAETKDPGSNQEVQKLREELIQIRRELLERADAQIARGERAFADDQRSVSVKEAVVPDNFEVNRQRLEIDRREQYESILANEQRFYPSLLFAVLRTPLILVLLLIGTGLLIFTDTLSEFLIFLLSLYYGPVPGDYKSTQFYSHLLAIFRLSGFGILAFGAFRLYQNAVWIFHFRRFRSRFFEQLIEMETPPGDLRRARFIMDTAIDEVGPRHAPDWARELLRREGIPNDSPGFR